MNVSRRSFIKSSAATSAALAVGLNVPQSALAKSKIAEGGWKWDKAVCRFCGVGCGEMIATKNDKIVAIKGDPANPVNKGLNCIKGYFNAKIMYGADRLTQPLLRMDKKGNFDKKGQFKPISWKRAFDEMEKNIKKTLKEKGPTGIGVFSSGQHTIQEGYAFSKFVKAGLRSNNIDPNARHCMASAVVGFYQTFGIDEPSGNYDDIELTNTIVTWGANMAEMHPILWSRVSDKKLSDPKNVKLINLTTFNNRTSHIADTEIIFKPHTDLAILNYIAREMLYENPKSLDWDFIKNHTIFATGFADIGYGMRELAEHNKFTKKEIETTLNQKRKIISKTESKTLSHLGYKQGDVMNMKHSKQAAAHWQITFEHFKKGLEPYTLDFVARLAKGDDKETLDVFKAKLHNLANIYMQKNRKIVSYWTMGVNQHTRGSWVNEQIYMLHLLTGKQAKPGSGAFSLTGQPSACGTAREVGTFAHRLPADMLVKNANHRSKTEKIWKVPKGTINPKNGSHYTQMMRDLEDEKITFAWVSVCNPWQNTANANHWIKAARELDNFIVVSDSYPGISAKVADLILPSAMIYEKWGAYGNSERRTQHWKQQVTPIGKSMSDTWQVIELSKRLKLSDVWKEAKIDKKTTLPNVLSKAQQMGYKPTDTLYEVLFANTYAKTFNKNGLSSAKPNSEVFGDKRAIEGSDGHIFEGYGFFLQKYLWEEYRKFGLKNKHDLAGFHTYHLKRGLKWPVVNGKETPWRFNEKYDPYVKKYGGKEFAFYGPLLKELPKGDLKSPNSGKAKFKLTNKAKIFFRPYMDPPEMPNKEYPLWLSTGRVLEHWHSGTMTMRVPELFKAVPEALCYMNKEDALKYDLSNSSLIWIESRRGKVKAKVDISNTRNKLPKGLLFVPWFDEKVFINKVALDATCPLSKQTDFKKCAVKIYKA